MGHSLGGNSVFSLAFYRLNMQIDDDPELLRYGMGNSYDMGALYYDTGALYYDTGSGQQAQLVGESRVFSRGFICNTLRFLYYDMEIFITIWKSLLRYGWGEVTHLLGDSRVFSKVL